MASVKELIEIKYPECAVCGCKVQRMDKHQDLKTLDLVFDIYCHGQYQNVRLPLKIIHGSAHISVGKAFLSSALPESQKQISGRR